MFEHKPSILIYVNGAPKDALKEIMAGIEEEGVLCEVVNKGAPPPVLEVEIFVNGYRAELALKGRPLFTAEGTDLRGYRDLGANAARAVKNSRFKLAGDSL